MSYPAPVPDITRRRPVQRGDNVKGDGYVITVFHPYRGFYSTLTGDQDENDYSVVLRIDGKTHSFLFTGDISQEAEQDISHLKGRLKSTALKVPHHGSRHSLVEEFLHYVSPDIAVISAGKKNTLGHPHQETIEAYSKSTIFRTDADGAVGIAELPDGTLRVQTAREFRIREAQTPVEEYMNIKKLFRTW